MSHINAKRWRQIEPMLGALGIHVDFKRNFQPPFARGVRITAMTPQRMAYRVLTGESVLLWWNNQEPEIVQEAIAFLQMLDHTHITVLR